MHKAPTATLPLNLSFVHSTSSLQKFLEERVARPLILVLTGNSTSMLSARQREGVLHVRLHRMFAQADGAVLDEIAAYLLGKRGAMPGFRKYLREHRDQLCTKPPKSIPLSTKGKFHDLRVLFDEVNGRYFDGCVNSSITWGTGSRGAVRKRTLGSYSSRSNTIRINPVLDRGSVPGYYVAFVVYHEMLHAVMGVVRKGDRRSVHPAEFRERERLFKDYEKARNWERSR